MKKISKIILITLLPFLVQSCFIVKAGATKKMESEYTVDNEAIPTDFGVNKSEVLLVQLTNKRSRNKYRKNAVKNEYQGKYELIEYKTNIDTKFPDKTKYRFVFDSEIGTTIINTNGANSQLRRYFVYDRLNEKKYISGAEFGFFAQALKIYMKNLNNQRLKN